MRRFLSFLALSLLGLMLAACATPQPEALPRPKPQEVSELAQAIAALGPGVSPDEARSMALIAYEYPLELARAYRIEDPPIIHNMKVNQGIKPRGLCYQWADDLEARLRSEGYTSIAFHRAIANSENPLRIEHSTVIVSAPGADMYDGIVLDPWRRGGRLFWSRVTEDDAYPWLPRQEVFERKRARRLRAATP